MDKMKERFAWSATTISAVALIAVAVGYLAWRGPISHNEAASGAVARSESHDVSQASNPEEESLVSHVLDKTTPAAKPTDSDTSSTDPMSYPIGPT